MSIYRLNNHLPAYKNPGLSGVGSPTQIGGVNWMGFVANKANDVAYIRGADCLGVKVDQGVAIQGSMAFEVSYSLSNPATALNPDPVVQTGVIWTTPASVAANVITMVPNLFAAMRIKFLAKGEFYVVSR